MSRPSFVGPNWHEPIVITPEAGFDVSDNGENTVVFMPGRESVDFGWNADSAAIAARITELGGEEFQRRVRAVTAAEGFVYPFTLDLLADE